MKKSNPIGVRFDLEKLEMIQKEQNLTSAQQVVNYLMDNYGKNAPKSENKDKTIESVIKAERKKELEVPAGLKGIDLIIWKIENKK